MFAPIARKLQLIAEKAMQHIPCIPQKREVDFPLIFNANGDPAQDQAMAYMPTPSSGETVTATYEGDPSGAYNGSSATTTVNGTSTTPWQLTGEVRSNDPQQASSITLGEATVYPNTGGVSVSQPLNLNDNPSDPANASFSLVYNSDTVASPVIVEASLTTDPSATIRALSAC